MATCADEDDEFLHKRGTRLLPAGESFQVGFYRADSVKKLPYGAKRPGKAGFCFAVFPLASFLHSPGMRLYALMPCRAFPASAGMMAGISPVSLPFVHSLE